MFARKLLSWNAPLLPQVVEHLMGEAVAHAPLQLDHLVVITPTRQSARRLHEALVRQAASQKTGLLPPLIVTPETLFHSASRELHSAKRKYPPASRSLVMATWAKVLNRIDLNEYRQLFPVDPQSRDSHWALRIASQLEKLQTELCDFHLDFNEVAERVAEGKSDHMEPGRWKELANLEDLYAKQLEAIEKSCPCQVRRKIARSPHFHQSVTKIIMAGTPDPSPLALSLLESAQQSGKEVLILQYGPDEDPDLLWKTDGRPEFEKWKERNLPLGEPLQIHLCHGTRELAHKTHELLVETSDQQPAALGIVDSEFIPAISQELEARQIPVYDPSGISLATTEPGRVMQRIQDFALQKDFYPTWNLLRDPAFSEQVMSRPGTSTSHAKLLEEIDQLQSRHLCHSFESLEAILSQKPGKFPLMAKAFTLLKEWRHVLREGPLNTSLEKLLLQFFGERWLTESNAEQRLVIEALQAFNSLLLEIQELREHYPDLSGPELHSLIGNLVNQSQLYPERPAHTLDLQGWLEMLWEDAPTLVLAGFHDSVIPSHIHGDAFLPETLRSYLQMTTNQERQGRDAYLLQALIASRSQGKGTVHLLIADWGPAGSALRPSRLLFQTNQDPLFLQQVERLIGTLPKPEDAVLSRVPLPVLPPLPADPSQSIPVSGFRLFLNNPFDFYLRYRLGWETYPIRKSEMDRADFGTLFHAIMQRTIEQNRKLKITSAKELYALMEHVAELEMAQLLGTDYTLPVRLQWQNLKTRLQRCADIEAESIQEGWQNLHTEYKIEYPFNGWTIRGIIDRIDHNPSKGTYRIIDYKTGKSQNRNPQASHYKKIRGNSAASVIPQANFDLFSKGTPSPHTWTDLQLPLYALATMQEFTPPNRHIAPDLHYFSVPPSAEEVSLSPPWTISDEELQAAQNCIEGVLQAIANNQFWSERENTAFSSFFPDGIAQAVNPQPFLAQ